MKNERVYGLVVSAALVVIGALLGAVMGGGLEPSVTPQSCFETFAVAR